MEESYKKLDSDFASELKKMSEMANADAMTPNQYQAMLLINGTTDKDLFNKILEMGKTEFTIQKICAKAKIYESEQIMLDSLKKKGGELVKMVNTKETHFWRCDGTGHNQFNCSYPEEKLVCKICSPAHFKSRKHNE